MARDGRHNRRTGAGSGTDGAGGGGGGVVGVVQPSIRTSPSSPDRPSMMMMMRIDNEAHRRWHSDRRRRMRHRKIITASCPRESPERWLPSFYRVLRWDGCFPIVIRVNSISRPTHLGSETRYWIFLKWVIAAASVRLDSPSIIQVNWFQFVEFSWREPNSLRLVLSFNGSRLNCQNLDFYKEN